MRSRITTSLALLCLLFSAAGAARSQGFTPIFDGKTLNGWTVVGASGPGYIVRNGEIVCPSDGGGFLFTDRDYSDFVLRFEFLTESNGNNGVAIRSARTGNPAFESGMEIQILDDNHPDYANLGPSNYCGSIYNVTPARRGAIKPAGEWNIQEISAIGRRIRITINGQTVVDQDLNDVTDPAVLMSHAGLLRPSGAIGFMGHGPSEVRFRNLRIRDLSKPAPDNVPPEGFQALFNGRDLTGWKGLVDDPPTRAKMTPEALKAAEAAATVEALKHWKAVDGVITYDGKNNSLCTDRDYGDFELLVDWKIPKGGDSGLYLRGTPQVQIWDEAVGSGGLYNNQANPSQPIRKADNPTLEWNRFRVLMVGEKVTIHLNDELVVNNVTMENYWERDKPIYPTGQIELQHHGSDLWFKNIYIREIPRP